MTAVIAAVAWVLFAPALALAVGRGLKRADRRPSYPPPVPPSRPRITQADIFATWSADLPVDCLSDDEVALRAEQIEAAEDFDWMPGAWS